MVRVKSFCAILVQYLSSYLKKRTSVQHWNSMSKMAPKPFKIQTVEQKDIFWPSSIHQPKKCPKRQMYGFQCLVFKWLLFSEVQYSNVYCIYTCSVCLLIVTRVNWLKELLPVLRNPWYRPCDIWDRMGNRLHFQQKLCRRQHGKRLTLCSNLKKTIILWFNKSGPDRSTVV